jgi:hypothetical protein
MRHSLNYNHKNENYGHKKEKLSQFNSTNSTNESRNFSRLRHTNFLICKLCFWCASSLYGPYEAVENCPMYCNNNTNCSIESMPISKETFEHDKLSDISLDVFPIRKDK